jgi:hypothetical protein
MKITLRIFGHFFISEKAVFLTKFDKVWFGYTLGQIVSGHPVRTLSIPIKPAVPESRNLNRIEIFRNFEETYVCKYTYDSSPKMDNYVRRCERQVSATLIALPVRYVSGLVSSSGLW